MNPFSLENKTILITGASSGIGRQCAIDCSNMGAKVIILGRDEKRLEETYGKLNQGKSHKLYIIDLTDFNKVDELVGQIFEENGRFNGIINSAGISETQSLKMTKINSIQKFFDINVLSSINLVKTITPKKYYSENGGSIVFLSSVMGVVGEIGKTNYSISKGAIISGVKSLALEFAQRKIRVNSISPGVVESPMSQKAVYSQNDESLKKIKELHPLGLGKPEDVSNLCIFLLSDASRWITGTNILIDGGYTAR